MIKHTDAHRCPKCSELFLREKGDSLAYQCEFCEAVFMNTRRCADHEEQCVKLTKMVRCDGYGCNMGISREKRLARVLNAVHKKDERIISKLDALHDHKGHLEVFWKVRPETWEKRSVEDAWIAEGENTGKHEMGEEWTEEWGY